MTSPIVSVEIGRSTWQGPAEKAPGGAGNRDADMGECFAFSAGYEAGERDGRASGQQVRALVANLSVWAGKAHPDQQLVDLAHVLAILDSNPAALTPAPRPSETVAEALSGLMEAYKEIADSGDAGFWKAEETPEYQAAVAALRALKGGAHG